MVATIKEFAEELWWLFILQGVASIIFGIVALFMPGTTLLTLVVILAIYAIVVGVIDLVHGFSSIGKNSTWWLSILLGLVLTGVGIYLIRHPLITLGAFIILVGTVLLVRGIFDLVASAFFSGHGHHRWLMAISGVLGVIAGIYIWNNPVGGGLVFIWALGLYALITGAMTIAYGTQMRGTFEEIRRRLEATVEKPSRVAHGHK